MIQNNPQNQILIIPVVPAKKSEAKNAPTQKKKWKFLEMYNLDPYFQLISEPKL